MGKKLCLLGAVLLALWAAVACTPPPGRIDLQLYYTPDERGVQHFRGINIFKISMGGSGILHEGEETQFSPTEGGKLPNVKCDKSKPNDTIKLSIEVVGYSDEGASRPSHSGRQVFFHKCGYPRTVPLFVSPIGEFSPLTEFIGNPDEMSAIVQTDERLAGYRMVLLSDGRVFLTGGGEMSGPGVFQRISNRTFLFDPETNSFSDGPKMSSPRAFHTATVVGPRVIVAGGLRLDGGKLETVRSVDVFDIRQDGTLERVDAPPMNEGRAFHTATITPRSKNLLLYGGLKWDPTKAQPASVGNYEIYSTSGDVDNIHQGALTGQSKRAMHTATLMSNGRIVLIGGLQIGTAGIEVFDSVMELRFKTSDEKIIESSLANDRLKHKRAAHTATLLSDGKLLVVGGMIPSSTNVFAPATVHRSMDLLSENGSLLSGFNVSLAAPRVFHTTSLLEDGRVMVYGGLQAVNRMNDKAELYQPDSKMGIQNQPIVKTQIKNIFHHGAIVPLNGTLVLFGGVTFESAGSTNYVTMNRGYIFNPGPRPAQ